MIIITLLLLEAITNNTTTSVEITSFIWFDLEMTLFTPCARSKHIKLVFSTIRVVIIIKRK